MTAYLDLADYLLIAERVLGVPAEAIAHFNRIGLAASALAAPQALCSAIVLAACGQDPIPTPTHSLAHPDGLGTSTPSAAATNTASTVDLHSPPALSLNEVPLTCGSPLAFGVDALAAAPGAERAAHPAAQSLRQLIAQGSVPDRSGWRLVVFDADGVLFLLPGVPEEDVMFWNAELGPALANWNPVRWGQCDIQPAFEGMEPARWELAPQEQVGPDTTTFDVRVLEQACASGMSPEGRIVGPAVIELEASLIVILGTRPPPGQHTCEPGPAVTVRVQLPGPLGNRQLLDGATFPAEPRS